MATQDIELTITPYTPSTLPDEDALINAAKKLLGSIDTWKAGKTFSGTTAGKTRWDVHSAFKGKGPHDGAAWHARRSEHTERTFDEFWDGLGRDKALKEKEYIHELDMVKLLRTVGPNQTIWSLHYKFPPPVSPRVFTVLQVTHLTGGASGAPREGWIISVPVDCSEDAELKKEDFKGTRGRYVSVERIQEGENGKVDWLMATSSTPGGKIPQFVVERTMPGQVHKDVPNFLEWLEKQKTSSTSAASASQPAPASDPTPAPAVPAEASESKPQAPPPAETSHADTSTHTNHVVESGAVATADSAPAADNAVPADDGGASAAAYTE